MKKASSKQIDEFYARHNRVALFFSGGKDSACCLELCKPYWNRTEVVWVDTGKNLPEVGDYVVESGRKCAALHILKTDRAAFTRQNGMPTDVLPTDSSTFGLACVSDIRMPLCSKYECCGANIWQEFNRWSLTQTSCTGMIRGDRVSEHYISPNRPGQILNGMEVLFPIYEWKVADVLKYLDDKNKMIPRFTLAHSSFDCWDCTAYWEGLDGRIEYLQEHHPEKVKEVIWLLSEVRKTIDKDVRVLDKKMGEIL